MHRAARTAAPLIFLVLGGAVLILLAIAAFLGGSLYAASAVLLALPVTGALATFRFELAPLSVALALSSPLALFAAFFAASLPGFGTGLAWLGLLLVVFAAILLSGYFGRHRKRILTAERADA
jgi:hypothetical protein